jgi:hypothetical protein
VTARSEVAVSCAVIRPSAFFVESMKNLDLARKLAGREWDDSNDDPNDRFPRTFPKDNYAKYQHNVSVQVIRIPAQVRSSCHHGLADAPSSDGS